MPDLNIYDAVLTRQCFQQTERTFEQPTGYISNCYYLWV